MITFDVRSELYITNAHVEAAMRTSQFLLDQQVAKDSNFYIPKDTGQSEGSVLRSSHFGEGIVTWNTPYIKKIYYGEGFNFSKDINPNAQALWFEVAKSKYKGEWLSIASAATIETLRRARR